VAVPVGILAAASIVGLVVWSTGSRPRPVKAAAAKEAAPEEIVEARAPAVEPKKEVSKPVPQPAPAMANIVRLKATDPEASDRLQAAEIPAYELLAAGHGETGKAPGRLVAILGDSRLKHWGKITSLAFSKDGQSLATVGADDTAKSWDLNTGKLKRSFPVRMGPFEPHGIALSPDGRTCAIATGMFFDGIRLWDTETGMERRILKMNPEVPVATFCAVAFSPDGRLVAGAGWRDAQRDQNRNPPVGWRGESLVGIWNARTGRLLRTMPATKQSGASLCFFSRDGNKIFAQLAGALERTAVNTIKAWEVTSGKETLSKEVSRAETYAMTVPPVLVFAGIHFFQGRDQHGLLCRDGESLVYRESKEPGKTQFVVVDLAPWRERARVDLKPDVDFYKAYPTSIMSKLGGLSPDGKTLCVWGHDLKQSPYRMSLQFWNLATGDRHVPSEAPPNHAGGPGTYSPDGRKLAFAGGAAVTLWDVVAEKEPFSRARLGSSISSICFSPDGSLLALGVSRGVVLWDIAGKTEARRLDGYGPVAFSPDGRKLALLRDSKLRLCDVATGSEKLVFEDGPSPLSALAFSHDGQSIALGYGNGRLELREAATAKVQKSFQGFESRLESVVFSPDGRWLAAAGSESKSRPLAETAHEDLKASINTRMNTDKTVKFWEVATGKLNRVIPGPEGPLAFSPDSQTLATGGFDDGYRDKLPLWDVATGKPRLLQGHKQHDVSAAFSPDGQTIATWGGDGTVRLWDAATCAQREVITLCSKGGAERAAFSPTGRYLATANANGTVYIMRLTER
jgi:WD40 repeat protein